MSQNRPEDHITYADQQLQIALANFMELASYGNFPTDVIRKATAIMKHAKGMEWPGEADEWLCEQFFLLLAPVDSTLAMKFKLVSEMRRTACEMLWQETAREMPRQERTERRKLFGIF